MTERAGDAATFEPTAVAPRRSTGGLTLAGWMAIVVAIVGLGIAGRLSAISSPAAVVTPTVAPTPTNVSDLAALVPAPGDPGLLHRTTLTGDAAGIETTITMGISGAGGSKTGTIERKLVINGGVLARASSVVVSVEQPAGRIVQVRGQSLPGPDSIRPDVGPTVTVSFLLTTPPDGRIWVDVTALDSSGRAIADVYRELAVGSGAASSEWRSVSQSAIAK
jgi:hypothetical protein